MVHLIFKESRPCLIATGKKALKNKHRFMTIRRTIYFQLFHEKFADRTRPKREACKFIYLSWGGYLSRWVNYKKHLRLEFYSAIQILEKNEKLQQYISPEVGIRQLQFQQFLISQIFGEVVSLFVRALHGSVHLDACCRVTTLLLQFERCKCWQNIGCVLQKIHIFK